MKYIFPACSAVVQKPVEQSCTILDANGIGIFSLVGPIKGFVKLASDIGQDYYPEMLGKMTIINVGFLFRAIWSMVKAFIDAKTQAKISLLKSSYQEELLKLVDANNLPKFLGGNCTCDNFVCGCLGTLSVRTFEKNGIRRKNKLGTAEISEIFEFKTLNYHETAVLRETNEKTAAGLNKPAAEIT